MIKKKKNNVLFVLIGIIVLMGIGYAYLTANLSINGTSNITASSWNIHFENVHVKNGSVTADAGPVINADGNNVSYSVTFNSPGDYFEFTVDVKNSGTIDGMIDSFSSNLNGVPITTLPDYLDYSVMYDYGVAISNNQLLPAGSKDTIVIKVGYKRDVSANQLPATNQSLSFNFTINYKQADDNAVLPTPVASSFSTDSWPTIIKEIKSGNTHYHLGDTKSIDVGSYGTHNVRISNTSTPSECNNQNFSQTACGIVIEFTDIVMEHRMNPFSWLTPTEGGNNGGWPNTEVREILNNDFYNELPQELRNSIVDTRVISGHGKNDSSNFVSTDKIYIFSGYELYTILYQDLLTEDQTRQLDFYSSHGITSASNELAVKKYNNVNVDWWLRSAKAYIEDAYSFVDKSKYVQAGDAAGAKGVSPAFRLG